MTRTKEMFTAVSFQSPTESDGSATSQAAGNI